MLFPCQTAHILFRIANFCHHSAHTSSIFDRQLEVQKAEDSRVSTQSKPCAPPIRRQRGHHPFDNSEVSVSIDTVSQFPEESSAESLPDRDSEQVFFVCLFVCMRACIFPDIYWTLSKTNFLVFTKGLHSLVFALYFTTGLHPSVLAWKFDFVCVNVHDTRDT